MDRDALIHNAMNLVMQVPAGAIPPPPKSCSLDLRRSIQWGAATAAFQVRHAYARGPQGQLQDAAAAPAGPAAGMGARLHCVVVETTEGRRIGRPSRHRALRAAAAHHSTHRIVSLQQHSRAQTAEPQSVCAHTCTCVLPHPLANLPLGRSRVAGMRAAAPPRSGTHSVTSLG
jgi:hypothetical protein